MRRIFAALARSISQSKFQQDPFYATREEESQTSKPPRRRCRWKWRRLTRIFRLCATNGLKNVRRVFLANQMPRWNLRFLYPLRILKDASLRQVVLLSGNLLVLISIDSCVGRRKSIFGGGARSFADDSTVGGVIALQGEEGSVLRTVVTMYMKTTSECKPTRT